MPDLPVFSKIAADHILKRAAEIEGSEDARPLSLEELRSIASEAGFGYQAVERSIAEAQLASRAEVRSDPVQRSGLVITHLSTVRAIPIDITSEQLMRAVRLLQPYRDGPAHINLEEHQVTWRDRKGLRFTVTSAAGVTEIRVMVSRPIARARKWTTWVKAAADRLESLIYLVAARDLGDAPRIKAAKTETPEFE